MKKIFLISGLLILVGVTAALAMEDFSVSGTWRYKMTVVVETPEGIKSGFAVREVSNARSRIELDLPQAVHPAKVVGEAVAVDLGKRGVLFALLNGYRYGPNHSASVLYEVFPTVYGGSTMEGIKYYKNLKNAKASLEPSEYPVLAMFRDISDPKSIEPVMKIGGGSGYVRKEEYKIQEDRFSDLFGEGVRLREITIEMTDEPVTSGLVDRYLPSNFQLVIRDGWRALSLDDRRRLSELVYFKMEENK